MVDRACRVRVLNLWGKVWHPLRLSSQGRGIISWHPQREAKVSKIDGIVIIPIRLDRILVPQGRKEVIKVRVSSLSIANKALEKGVL